MREMLPRLRGSRENWVTLKHMRKQYYFRPSERGLLAWDIDRLVELTAALPSRRVPLSQLRELDEPVFGEGDLPTWRSLVEHIKLIDEADLSYPIILACDGSVMDGRHRLAKAARLGLADIEARQFLTDPEPDYIGRAPHELPY
jgi:hypothetical protein